jgi:predicted porin
MQKKIIALAVAALASTAAFAQTNVTVYGVADATFDGIIVSDSLNQANNVGSFNRVSANSSYIGFKGTEDLGNGLKAVFQFENTVGFDSGATVATNRDSFVGLSSGMGTVVAGNMTGPTRGLGASLDVNEGATGIGANAGIIGKLGGGTGASRFDTRWANAVAYVSPSFAGVTLVGAYVADEDKTREGVDNSTTANVGGVSATGATTVTVNTPARTTGYDVGAKWEGAGFMAGIAYNWYQAGNMDGTASDNIRLGGSYKGAWGAVNLMWEETKVETIGSSNKQQKWGIGGAFNIGKGAVIGQYYQALESDNVKNNGAQLVEVGYRYSLSKRTSVRAIYAWLDNESAANFDYGVNAAAAGTATGATIQGLSVGLRHSF